MPLKIKDDREKKVSMSQEEIDAITQVRSRIDNAFNTHNQEWTQLQNTWFTQEAFYLGFHWLSKKNSRWFLSPPQSPSWRVRLVDNRIQAYVNTTLSKVLRHSPQFEVLPQSAEKDDREAARIGGHVLEHLWRHLGLADVYESSALMAIIYGTAFVKVTWNPLGGTQFHAESVSRDAKPVSTTPGKAPRQIANRGEIEVEAVPPHEIWVPLGIENEQEAPYVIHGRYMSKEDVDVRWPLESRYEKKEIVAEAVEAPFLPNAPTDKHISQFNTETKHNQIFPDGVIVKEYWEKPCLDYPKGRWALTANGVILKYQEKLPFGLTNYPFHKIVQLPVPRRFHGRSVIADLIPLNKELNKTLSQIVENKNLMSRPKWITARGSGIAENAITSEPGEVIEYNPGVPPPSPVAPPPIPNYVIHMLDRIVQGIFDVPGQHEVTRAQVPAGVESGVAIQFLQEQDDTRLAPFIRRLDRVWSRVGKQMLLLVKKKYTEERTVKIVGKDREVEVLSFTGKDLKDNTDVQVVLSAGLPEGKVARQQFIMNLFDRGLLGFKDDPQTWKRALKFLEFGESDDLFQEELSTTNKVRRHIAAIINNEEGPEVQAHPLDDHVAAMTELRKVITSGQVTDEEVMEKLEFRYHVHEQMLQQAQAQLQAQTEVLPEAMAPVENSNAPPSEREA